MPKDDSYREKPGRHRGVAAVWSFASVEAASHLVPADGCFDLIVRVGDREACSASVYTPVTAAHTADVAAGAHMLGVRVRAGYGAALVEHDGAIARAIASGWTADEAGLDGLESLVRDANGFLVELCTVVRA